MPVAGLRGENKVQFVKASGRDVVEISLATVVLRGQTRSSGCQ